jgi:hypothetical protein
MKKTTATAIALILAFSLAACGGNGNGGGDGRTYSEAEYNRLKDERDGLQDELDALKNGGNNASGSRPPTDLEETPASDFDYKYNAELSGIEITQYTGTSIRVRIPQAIEGQPVKIIGDKAFFGSGIMEVYVLDSVVKIGNGAFSNCTGLTNLVYGGEIRAGILFQMDGYLWRVLEVRDGKALIISEDIVGRKAYNTELMDITWADCSLRAYLNNDFYNTLSTDTQARIAETQVTNNDNPNHGTPGGANTTDKIFLLSIDEARTYFNDNAARIAYDSSGSASWWWLRSPGDGSIDAAYVVIDGRLHGHDVNSVFGGVRPALWLNL